MNVSKELIAIAISRRPTIYGTGEKPDRINVVRIDEWENWCGKLAFLVCRNSLLDAPTDFVKFLVACGWDETRAWQEIRYYL